MDTRERDQEVKIAGRYPPTSRPLAEPPIFDYDKFVVEEKIPSDARHERMFKKDIARDYRCRDALTGKKPVFTHGIWTANFVMDVIDEGRRAFYAELNRELHTEGPPLNMPM